ncbi:hypothetical protein PV08_11943 [Exophiala spinifera]|uniref:Methyltransferase type 11 domain-containing protein n=1 Tax=Exophiala spinifera TaxID=91928 RepID=A0A0D1Z9Z2_9EURO|nr:uncharacterized protein PV08_11943 [Exophiala spinifera]KIW09842.1 hypothetical protein PV08_11943 [Exophiala spinifera]
MPTVSEYYHTLESRIGYRLILGGTRHFGYYREGTLWPFPLGDALRRMEDHLYRTLNLRDGSLVLDAGTGNGDVAIFMARKGLKVKAIDLLPMHVGWARENVKRKHLGDQIEVSCGNYEQLKFDDDTFDGAYTMETLVHASEPQQAMREFYRVLKPGGVVTHVEYEHHMDNDPVGLHALRQINTYAHMPAFDQFTLNAIREMLQGVGFQDVEVQDLSNNVAPMMRFFFILAFIPYLIIKLLGLEAYFVNAMAGVELWRHRDHVRFLMVKARKPVAKLPRSDEWRSRPKASGSEV